jgi:uncharacterized protein (TIGR03643 family)
MPPPDNNTPEKHTKKTLPAPTPKQLSEEDIDRIIEMAWEDRTTFEAIEFQFGLPESEVIALMRRHMKASSFKRWRARVSGRSTKHQQKRSFDEGRFKCSRQKSISFNKISKRK